MREIRFRAWDKINKKMLSWDEICEECLIADILTCNLYIPLQYTGLKDSEGIEIYEGDNIQYTQALFNTEEKDFPIKTKEVKYLTYIAKWNIFETNAGEYGIKIIGNIYEGLKIDL